MRAGKLDAWITIQRATVTQSPSGEPIETWSHLSKRPAMLEPLTGYERFTTEQLVAKEQVTFTIRWAQIVDDVSPLDRIIYPALQPLATPEDVNIYDIIVVHQIGPLESLAIIAFRRTDVTLEEAAAALDVEAREDSNFELRE